MDDCLGNTGYQRMDVKMSKVVIEKRDYLLFDKYELNSSYVNWAIAADNTVVVACFFILVP